MGIKCKVNVHLFMTIIFDAELIAANSQWRIVSLRARVSARTKRARRQHANVRGTAFSSRTAPSSAWRRLQSSD